MNVLINNQDVFRKYEKAGPSYFLYPTVIAFEEHDKLFKSPEMLQDLIDEKSIDLQLFFPFCCQSNHYSIGYKIINDEAEQALEYIDYIKQELELYRPYLHGKCINQVHFSGSPTYYSENVLSNLIEYITRIFSININAIKLSIEVDSHSISDIDLASLKKMGFQDLLFQTASFDSKVQSSIDASSLEYSLEEILITAKKHQFSSLCVDLTYGLPFDSKHTVETTIDQLIAMPCASISLSQYKHRPYLFDQQKYINLNHLPSAEENYCIFQNCVEKILSSDYQHLAMGFFVKKNSPSSAANNKNNRLHYTLPHFLCNANSVVSIGVASVSQYNSLYYQNHKKLTKYYGLLEQDALPIWRDCQLNDDDRLRRDVIHRLICHYEVNIKKIQTIIGFDFFEYFKDVYVYLKEMERDGLLKLSKNHIKITELGRYFIGSICGLFDTYLDCLMKIKR